MANEDQRKILSQGVDAWDNWRAGNPDAHIDFSRADFSRADQSWDLSGADLSGADLRVANLRGVDLSGADLSGANFEDADLTGADLSEATLINAALFNAILCGAKLGYADLTGAYLSRADLSQADLSEANFRGADLSKANLSEGNFRRADLSGANLSGANLSRAILIETNLERANLTGCFIYGISAWELKLEGTRQNDLVITLPDQPAITVDNLEVALWIFLLLHNERIRQIIDAMTSKIVLILGRFTDQRKPVLDAIRNELRRHNYMPVFLDLEGLSSHNRRETVFTLAHMARFILADITDAKSILAELGAIVSQLPFVAFQPLILASDYEFEPFEHKDKERYPWILTTYKYANQTDLLASLNKYVITPAEEKASDLNEELENLRTSSSEALTYIISYSWTDKDFAIQLCSDLRTVGVRCRLLERDEGEGVSWEDQICKTIQAKDKVLLVLSRTSFEEKKDIEEINKAFKLRGAKQTKVVFPIFLFPISIKSDDPLRNEGILIEPNFEFSQWQDKKQYQRAFSKLARDLALLTAAESRSLE